jgi:hypothetical protein
LRSSTVASPNKILEAQAGHIVEQSPTELQSWQR